MELNILVLLTLFVYCNCAGSGGGNVGILVISTPELSVATTIFMVLLTIVLEQLLHKANHLLEGLRMDNAIQLVNKILTELMLLGIISLLIGVLGSEFIRPGKLQTILHWAHMLLFYMALFFVSTKFVQLWGSKLWGYNYWNKIEQAIRREEPNPDSQMDSETLSSLIGQRTEKLVVYFVFRSWRQQLQLECGDRFNDVSFSRYLLLCQRKFLVRFTEIYPLSWLGLCFLSLFNLIGLASDMDTITEGIIALCLIGLCVCLGNFIIWLRFRIAFKDYRLLIRRFIGSVQCTTSRADIEKLLTSPVLDPSQCLLVQQGSWFLGKDRSAENKTVLLLQLFEMCNLYFTILTIHLLPTLVTRSWFCMLFLLVPIFSFYVQAICMRRFTLLLSSGKHVKYDIIERIWYRERAKKNADGSTDELKEHYPETPTHHSNDEHEENSVGVALQHFSENHKEWDYSKHDLEQLSKQDLVTLILQLKDKKGANSNHNGHRH